MPITYHSSACGTVLAGGTVLTRPSKRAATVLRGPPESCTGEDGDCVRLKGTT